MQTDEDDLVDLFVTAEREYAFALAFEDIRTRWQEARFVVAKADAASDVLLIDNGAEVQRDLQSDMLSLSSMITSKYCTPIRLFCKDRQQQLGLVAGVVEVWLEVQALWQEIEPVFRLTDMGRQMPGEGRAFSQLDKDWTGSSFRLSFGVLCDSFLFRLRFSHVYVCARVCAWAAVRDAHLCALHA